MTDAERCYLSALRILGYRFNSEAELRRKLQAKKFEKAIIDSTLARLREEKWLDDERFAGAFVRTRARKRGAKRILRELHATGVRREVAEEAVRQNVDAGREREALEAACERRARLLARRHGAAYLESGEGRTKLTAWLLNQGYEASLVRDVLRACLSQLHF